MLNDQERKAAEWLEVMKNASEFVDRDQFRNYLIQSGSQALAILERFKAEKWIAEYIVGFPPSAKICYRVAPELRNALDDSPPEENGPTENGLLWNGRLIPLTAKRHAFLLAAWNAQPGAISYAEISEAVWGDDSTEDNTIETFAKRFNQWLLENDVAITFSCAGKAISVQIAGVQK